MDLFDVINELRTGRPGIKKTAKAMKVLGWICVVGALWNFAIYQIAPFQESPLNLPPHYPHAAFFSLSFLGALFFCSATGIKDLKAWGKKSGQLAIVLFICVFWGFMFFIFPSTLNPEHKITLSTVFIIIIALTFSQFAIAAFFGVRYLGRLLVKDDIYVSGRYNRENRAQTLVKRIPEEKPASRIQYKDSLSPFGIVGTFALIMVGPLLSMPIVEKYGGQQIVPYVCMPIFFLSFAGPLVYNMLPSPFERERTAVATYTGGGAVFLFHCSWPFFRLKVYHDGIEVRVMFHRYFIPYDKMGDIPATAGFFNRGMLITSDLQDVPPGIRFNGFGMKGMLKVVHEARNNYKLSIHN